MEQTEGEETEKVLFFWMDAIHQDDTREGGPGAGVLDDEGRDVSL